MQNCLSTTALAHKPSLSNLINISVFPEQIRILLRHSDVPETPLRAGIIIFQFKVWSGFSRGEKRKWGVTRLDHHHVFRKLLLDFGSVMEKFSAAVGELVWISYLCYSQFSNIHTHADLKWLPSSIKLPLIDCLIPVVYKNICFGRFQTYQRCWPAKFSKIVLS